MERFARVVIGYHGCTKAFARKLLLEEAAIENWRPSANEDESITTILAGSFLGLAESFEVEGRMLPTNKGRENKLRALDCLVVNECLSRLATQGRHYDTVRAAFWEGEPIYPGAGFSREAHIQLVVRNPACLLGVFRPNLQI